jgi:hypothetical protein
MADIPAYSDAMETCPKAVVRIWFVSLEIDQSSVDDCGAPRLDTAA